MRAEVGVLPAGEDGEAHEEDGRNHDRDEDGVEVWWADGDLAKAEGVEEQRVEGAEHDGAGCGDQNDVVGEQHGFTRDHAEFATEADTGGTQGEQGECAADDDGQEGEDKQAAGGVAGEGVDGGQDAGTDQEGAEQRE